MFYLMRRGNCKRCERVCLYVFLYTLISTIEVRVAFAVAVETKGKKRI